MKKTSKHIHKKQTNGKKENREFIALHRQTYPSSLRAKEGSRKSSKLKVWNVNYPVDWKWSQLFNWNPRKWERHTNHVFTGSSGHCNLASCHSIAMWCNIFMFFFMTVIAIKTCSWFTLCFLSSEIPLIYFSSVQILYIVSKTSSRLKPRLIASSVKFSI